MKIFQVNKKISIVCEYHNTRNGFKHTAKLFINSIEVEETKVCYQNRTWESYEYETVIHKLIEKSAILTDEEKIFIKEYCKAKSYAETDKIFNTVSMIAKLGNIMTDNQKEANDWKARMLKAGLSNKGLIMPEDWDTLSEDEKTKRLDGVINLLGEKNEG